MKYDFNTVLERQGMDSLAADVIPFSDAVPDKGFSKIPMWVADMNFKTAPCIIKALEDRIAHPNFGYYELSDRYYESIISWHKKRNGAVVDRSAISYENGVLGALSTAVNALTSPGEPVLLHSPMYIGFISVLKRLNRKIILSPLKTDENGIWRMDYKDMSDKINKHGIRFAVFCSPHNPSGRVWQRDELVRAMDIFRENDVTVFSDEIWSDIIMDGYKHIPTASISDDAKKRTVSAYSASKTFSLAGLVGSYSITYDEDLRSRLFKCSEASGYNVCNVLSMHASIGGFSDEGEEWLEELNTVLNGNMRMLREGMINSFKGVEMMMPEGTYMLFANCRKWCDAHGISVEELALRGVRAGVIWQSGAPFGDGDCIRINTAMPKCLIEEAFMRLEKYVFI